MTQPSTVPASRTVRVRTTSTAQTRAFGAALASVARAGDRIALLGPLGAGKTQVAKGFGAGLGVVDEITSPSFTLMAEYPGRLTLFHLDLYRLAGTQEAIDGGMLDEREDDGVTLTEWAERLDAVLDPDRLVISIAPDARGRGGSDAPAAGTLDLEEDARVIVLEATSERYERYLEAARRWMAAPDADPTASTGSSDRDGG